MNRHYFPPFRFLAFVVLAVGALMAESAAQTVRPVIVQYNGTAKGKFELVNNTLQSMNVVIEPKSFTITEEGDGVYGPLAKDIHLKLSAMSLRIPPKQSRFVFYEAKTEVLPAWFVIYSVFAGPARQSGVNIQVDLPHTVYLLQKEPLNREDISVQSLKYLPGQHRVAVTIANNSSRLGRVLEWRIGSKQTKDSNSGFPLLPNSRRRLEVAWDAPNPPDRLWVRFEHFTFSEELSASRD
jgi:hypothetical protein